MRHWPLPLGREKDDTAKANVVLETTAQSKTEMLDQLVAAHRKDLEAVFEEKRGMQTKNEVPPLRPPPSTPPPLATMRTTSDTWCRYVKSLTIGPCSSLTQSVAA